MTQSQQDVVLLLLLLFTLGNLVMLLKIASIVRETPEPQDLPFTLPIGQPISAVAGHFLHSQQPFSSEQWRGQANVLVFLSANCGDCQKRAPQIAALLPAMQAAGVNLAVISLDKERKAREFLASSALYPHVVMLNSAQRKALNPRNASPFYVFVDDQLIAQASHFIGDENWLGFVEQLQQLQTTEISDTTIEIAYAN